MGARILLVEDEDNLAKLINTYLTREKAEVTLAADGQEALDKWDKSQYDLVILDVMLPVYDGWVICKKIREESSVPIIMLTARSEEYDRLFGFELGVDDYVTKPFSVKELVARAKALLKRTKKNNDDKVIFGNLVINKTSHQVFIDDKPIKLTPKEYDLLIYLLNNEGNALTRELVLDGVWGYDYFGDLRTVDTHIKRLRKKLQNTPVEIKTVRGIGYRFEVVKNEN
ncbi:response regulator transcription factor [Proteinivorax tanatarense]|uniref:Stage 0 sporulation protein A homolog n=1 Tax=Proteinivorax tanatarense TaxID=1260629 RepID=A0AAU7VQU0_9FIRM